MITLDGKSIQDFGYRAALEHYHEAIPNIRRKTMQIPGMPGSWDFGSELGSKMFEIPIRALSDSSLSLQYLQNELVAFLMDDYGNPRPLKMVFDYEPDKFYMVKVDASVAPSLRAHIIRHKTLIFVAFDPFKYAEKEIYDDDVINYDESYLYNDGHYYPNAYSVHLKYVHQYTGLHNHSHLATPLSFSITGKAHKPRITNLTTGRSIQVDVDLKENETLKINANNLSVILEGDNKSNEIFGLMTGDFLKLMPGDNSILITSGNPDASIDFEWLYKYN